MTEQHASPGPAPAVGGDELRAALGRFATGVAFVTATIDGAPLGLVINSLVSVSLSPPLVSFSPSRASLTWSRMRRAGRFGVNVLGTQHADFVSRATPPGADRFSGIAWTATASGVPRFTDALAFLECTIATVHRAGDHWIVLGHVQATAVDPTREPLVFWAGRMQT